MSARLAGNGAHAGQAHRHLTLAGGRTHAVQFYESEEFLAETVTSFLAGGLAAGQPLVVIATAPRRQAFVSRLRSDGFAVDHASHSGQLTLLDARETLDTFMEGPLPDADRFRASVGGVIERSLAGGTHTVARAYGEMVDLLWKDGNPEGAIRLEELWNDLATTHGFSLLCAYAMGNFYKEAHTEGFKEICRQHEHVAPTERYVAADSDARLLEITLLQQRAKALEAEIEHRKELEAALRDALAARRESERELKDFLVHLKHAEEERQRLLAREQAAREAAEAASRAKSDFLAVMSHELRTPLNAIGGHVQLIELGVHGPVTDAQREALERVQRSQRHLLALINDILNLARAESGRVEYELQDVPLAPLLADGTSTLEPVFRAGGLTCEIVLPETESGATLAVRADREKLRQILFNLLTNAVKFTAAGGRITIAAAPSTAVPGMVAVEVHDTGIGIPPAKLETIFEPFVQLAPRAPIAQGVGLGLAISRNLARGMGGDLTAASTPGQGSIFTLTLPQA